MLRRLLGRASLWPAAGAMRTNSTVADAADELELVHAAVRLRQRPLLLREALLRHRLHLLDARVRDGELVPELLLARLGGFRPARAVVGAPQNRWRPGLRCTST